MKKKIKIAVIILALIGVAGYYLTGHPVVFINNAKLKNSMQSIENQTVHLNDIVPFQWDTLYTFEPYSSEEEIEEIIGFKSAAIKENIINEGMVHLLFVKGDRVVASIPGYDSKSGYRIDFTVKEGRRVTFAENAQFNVTKSDGVTAC